MSVFANNYSSYLNYTANCSHRLQYFETIFRNAYGFACDPKFISVEFVNKIHEFPKFPYFMNIITKTDKIKLTSIYKVCLDSTEYLLDAMTNSKIVSLKTVYDTIPNEIENLIKHAYFQYTYLSSPSDIYNLSKVLKILTQEVSYRNFYIQLYSQKYKTVGTNESCGFEDNSAIIESVLVIFLHHVLPTMCNLSDKLLKYILYFNSIKPGDFGYYPGIEARQITKDNFKAGFRNFIFNNKLLVSQNLTELITKSIYNYNKLSDVLRADLDAIIGEYIIRICDSFDDYLDSLPVFEPNFDLVANFTNLLYYTCAVDLASRMFKNPIIVDQSYCNMLVFIEDDKFKYYMNQIDPLNLQLYLFLLYIYKFWPLKFLNLLQMVIKEYIQNEIKKPSDDYNAFSLLEYSNIVSRLYADEYQPFEYDEHGNVINPFRDAKINFDNLCAFLRTHFTLLPDNYLWMINSNYEISRFICQLYYVQLLDNFISSFFYVEFIKELLQTVFEYLRDNGHVHHLFNWYNNHEIVDVYLKIFLRYSVFNEINNLPGTRLFHGISANFKDIFDQVVTNYPDIEPIYNIDIVYKTPKELNDALKSLVRGNSINKMYQFNENLILSSLTRESFYAIISKFFSIFSNLT